MKENKENKPESPKTERDRRFLVVIKEIMARYNIKSDTQMSLILEEGKVFIYKVKSGNQSATAEHIEKIVMNYKASANYIFAGVGDLFMDDDILLKVIDKPSYVIWGDINKIIAENTPIDIELLKGGYSSLYKEFLVFYKKLKRMEENATESIRDINSIK